MSAIATALTEALRRFLAKRGYVVSHLEAGLPEALETYLGALSHREIGFERVFALDSDPETLNVFLNVFATQPVHFQSDPNFENLPLPIRKDERILLEADVAVLYPERNSALLSCLQHARVVVVRAKFSQFWTGKADLYDLASLMAKHGLHFRDVLQRPLGTAMSGPNGNVFFAFERGELSFKEAQRVRRAREFRISEALTHLGSPIVPESSLQRLTGRASHGFPAGLFNPGAFYDDGRLFLLVRGERAPWPIQKRSRASYLSSCQPVLLALREDLQISTATEVQFADPALSEGCRFEDFRVFTHRGRIYSNHSVIRCDRNHGDQALVRPERLQTSVGVSRFEVEQALLTPLGSPMLDRPVARVEKNWVMFSTGDRIHLIYSFNPYRLFSSSAFPDLHFASAGEHALKLPLPDDGLTLRNSINPVPYDSNHLLHIVHKVFPDKRYVFWAVLLDQHTLLPAKISRRPLLSARSSGASITYACSAICRDDELLMFGGIDDCSIGAWRIPKVDLDSQWSAIA
jgi:predicted GH43/DUF377 family glycosyl hydrolase